MGLFTYAIDNSDRIGTPVLFLHGFGGLGAQWRGYQMAVSYKAPTYAFDLPGHGKSLDYPEAGPPIIAARAVVQEMEELGIEQAHFVGHSMGGAIASLISLIAKNKVASLTLLAPGGYGREFNHPLLMKWAAAKTRDELQAVMPNFFGPDYEIPEKVFDFQFEARSRPGAVKLLITIGEGLSNDGTQGVLPLDDIMSQSLPISVVWGEEDSVLPVSQGHALKDKVDLHILKRVGHSPAEEAVEAVRSLILEQIKKD